MWFYQEEEGGSLDASCDRCIEVQYCDGAARGKLGHACIGGVLRNNKGEVLFMFSKSVGTKDSYEAEVVAILEALRTFF